MRPTFEKIYMDLALALAERSTCSRRHVGCVITTVDNQRVLSIGYNGNWAGGPNHCDSDEPGKCGCLHAEENALLKLNYTDPSPKRLYTTVSPCKMCAKRIINAGIAEVVYFADYRLNEGCVLLTGADVKCWKFVESRTSSHAEEAGLEAAYFGAA